MSDAVQRRVRMIERVDEYLESHRATESTRLLNEVRDELVRTASESTLRAQIAAEIEALKFNPGGIQLFIQMGGTAAWTEGWDDALTTAAETIRGDLAPTPCDCGIECACATDRKDAS